MQQDAANFCQLVGGERLSVPHRMLCLLKKIIVLIPNSALNDQKQIADGWNFSVAGILQALL